MPIRIVIVDDHEMLRDGLRARFEGNSDFLIVGEGKDGTEAIALFDKHQPDVLLSDIAMPKKNGLEAARDILKKFPHATIVFLSVYDDPQYLAEAKSIGAKGFVRKDVDKHEMLNAIRRVAQGGSHFDDAMLKGIQKHNQKINLTAREKEVLQEIAKGKTNKEIAYTLGLSVRTIESHRSSIRDKSGGGNAASLTKLASEIGLS